MKTIKRLLTIQILFLIAVFSLSFMASGEKTSKSVETPAPDIKSTSGAINRLPEPTKTMRVTAYCCCKKCCGKDKTHPAYKITASGYKIKQGDCLVAAPKSYGFHTRLIIPGYNNGQPVEVLDRGGAIKGNRLDVYFDTHEEALIWGVRYLIVQEVE